MNIERDEENYDEPMRFEYEVTTEYYEDCANRCDDMKDEIRGYSYDN